MSRYELLSVAEAAQELGRARWFIYGELARQRLAYHMIGGRKAISRADLDAYIQRGRVAALGEPKRKSQSAAPKTLKFSEAK